VGIRLSPFGLFKGTEDSNPVIHWSWLCRQLRTLQLAYVHIIEPREDTFISEEEKLKYLQGRAEKSGTVLQDWTTLRVFRRELGGEMGTVMVSAGGYDLDNPFEVVESGDADAVAYGRYARFSKSEF